VAYLVRQHDLRRVERLERVIRCQDSIECRRFIYRAIREILREAKQDGFRHTGSQGDEHSATLRFVSPSGESGTLVIPAPSSEPHGTSEQPSEPPRGQDKAAPGQGGGRSPVAPQPTPRAVPAPMPGSSGGSPRPTPGLSPPPLPAQPKLPPPAEEAQERVKETVPCTTIQELHELC